MYYVLFVKPKKQLSIKEKRKFIDSFVGDPFSFNEKLGIIEKFAKATVNSFVKEEETKKSIFDAFVATPFKETICSFYFSQNEIEIAKKWEKFLKKVYPELETFTDGSFEKPSGFELLLSYIYTNIQEFPVTLETSIDSKLDKNQLQQVKTIVEEMKEDNMYYVCRQFKCSVCKERNPEKPIHFEIDYHYKPKTKGHPECKKCGGVLYFNECEICENSYEFYIK